MGSSRALVFLNRFYWPDMAATAQMLTDLAEDLAASGDTVTVVTSRTAYAAGDGALPVEEVRNGVRIVRVGSTRFGRHRMVGRILDSFSYLLGAFVRLLRLPRPDAVVALSDPPFLVAAALAAGRMRGVPTVYWVMDLFPEIAVRLGVLREGGIVHRLTAALARRLNSACEAVVTLGPQMTRSVTRAGARPERTAHMDNWANSEAIRPIPREENAFVEEHDLRDPFVVLYSGNAGRAHTFDAVLEAARDLERETDVLFLFTGGGKKLPEIRSAAEAAGLGNVRFMDYVSRERLSLALSSASVSLVTEDPAVVGLIVPSKTYGIMASGRPLLFVGSPASDVAAIVKRHRCGLVVSPDGPAAIVAAIRQLRAEPSEAAAMGARGRRAAEEVYDRSIATRRWRKKVEQLLGWSGGSTAAAASPTEHTGAAAHD